MPELGTMPTEETAADDLSIDNNDTRSIIKFVLAKIANKQPRIQRYHDYYSGNHPLNYSSEKFTTEFADRLKRFRDNLCPTCVQAPADRLEVIGFAADSDSAIYKTTWDVWKYSQMPRFAKRVHRDAFKNGDAFLVVWYDEAGRARMWPQNSANCTVVYDPESQTVEVGAKVWKGTDKYIYLTLYFRDRIEKYRTKRTQSDATLPKTADSFEKRMIEDEVWPAPNPTGICPMFHFGREASILDDVIPLNDALNKSIADMLIGSESNSLLQRWVSGISYELNPETGKQIIPFDDFASWFAATDAAAKFGAFPEIDIQKMLEVVKDFRVEIASVAGIPPYYFRLESGNLPSGEALRKAEARFTALIRDAQLEFGESWSSAMEMSLKLDNKAPAEGEGSKIETRWSPADALSDDEKADLAIKKKNVGISTEKALSELGYTDKEIAEMEAQNQAAAKANADTFTKVFDAGPTIGG